MFKSTFNRVQLYRQFWNNIDLHLADNENDQMLASRAVFHEQGWATSVDGLVDPNACNVIYGSHYKFVDSCAFNLTVPVDRPCKRIVNRYIAGKIGQRYLNENFPVESIFNSTRFWEECEDWYTRFYYAISVNWTNKFPSDIASIVRWLRSGGNLILFPAGVFGRAKWQLGIGVFVSDYLRNSDKYSRPMNLVALKNEFDFSNKVLNVRMVEVIDADAISELFAAVTSAPNGPRIIASDLSKRYKRAH